ncbi:hypothetical protein B0J14DRAFT_611381 [Halenospora varia]|nr:hypothetical protein B0J14DRAFT_611381 [Halenospora varia]
MGNQTEPTAKDRAEELSSLAKLYFTLPHSSRQMIFDECVRMPNLIGIPQLPKFLAAARGNPGFYSMALDRFYAVNDFEFNKSTLEAFLKLSNETVARIQNLPIRSPYAKKFTEDENTRIIGVRPQPQTFAEATWSRYWNSLDDLRKCTSLRHVQITFILRCTHS